MKKQKLFNSGVWAVQISHTDAWTPAQYTSFQVTKSVQDFEWRLQPSGKIYIRVLDWAGNASTPTFKQGPARFDIYLPLVLRPA